MFRETITHAGGHTTGTANESHARYLLRRALRRGCDVEATPAGGALISWTVASFNPRAERRALARAIELAPEMPVRAFTNTMREDLALIDATPTARYEIRDERRLIRGDVWELPPFVTARLRARGLVVEDEHAGTVRLTLTAQLARLADRHRTHTTAPEGWHRPAADGYGGSGLSRPGRRNGLLYSGVSAAVCSCGELSAVGDDRDAARRLATAHRHAVTAEFITAELGARTP